LPQVFLPDRRQHPYLGKVADHEKIHRWLHAGPGAYIFLQYIAAPRSADGDEICLFGVVAIGAVCGNAEIIFQVDTIAVDFDLPVFERSLSAYYLLPCLLSLLNRRGLERKER